MKLTAFLLLTFASIVMTACGGSESDSNTSNANSKPQAANTAAANTGLEGSKTPAAATANDAPTLAPVVHAYYDALKKKDATGAKKVMSQGFVQSAEKEMQEEGDKDLVVYLTKFDKLPENRMEVRNEQISGNRATAELKGGSYTDWVKITFINEGGAWKITNEIPK